MVAKMIKFTAELNRNLVFIHIPKAAGSFVRKLFGEIFDENKIFPDHQLHHFPKYREVARNKPTVYRGHLGYKFATDANAMSATVLRNPVERILSVYSYSVNPGRGLPLIGNVPGDISILDFLRSDRPEIRMNLDESQTWQIGYGYSNKERHEFRTICHEDIIERAISNLYKIDFLGLTESLDAFRRSVMLAFGIDGINETAKMAVNKSASRIMYADLTPNEKLEVEKLIVRDRVLYETARGILQHQNLARNTRC
jgi:hypothetical protein